MAVRSILLPIFVSLLSTRLGSASEFGACVDSVDGSTCRQVLPSAESQSSASLLQREYKNVAKHSVLSESEAVYPVELTANCTGIVAQGTCWQLSEEGESCYTTCANHGLNYSYVAAWSNSTITTLLAGHEPVTKQKPWVAFECYNPDEDRYHPANANAAKHAKDLGSWSDPECRLACPCGNVTSNHTPAPPPPLTPAPLPTNSSQEKCTWSPAASCVPEFDYEGIHYTGCTSIDHDIPWCSNTYPYAGHWSNCVLSCPTPVQEPKHPAANQPPEHPPVQPPSDNSTQCSWQPKPNCAKSFVYQGRNYDGCSTDDHPTPWCSFDIIHKGDWATCDYICTPVNEDTAPCARHPEYENDAIGNLATLDDSGYKIVVAADSNINMKRFVCRVVDKIDCTVIDYSGLMAFLPWDLGSSIHKNYSTVESELSRDRKSVV